MSNNQKSSTGNPVSLVWLRRDLRLHDHAALACAAKSPEPVQPVFVFDTDILADFADPDDRRLTLIVRALIAMHKTLLKKGAGIIVLHGRAVDLIPQLCQNMQPARLIAAGDVEPATRQRDQEVKQALTGHTDFILVNDHLIQAPHIVLKEDGTPYRVFTPYAKAWRAKAASNSCFDERSTDKVRYVEYVSVEGSIDLAGGEEAVLAQLGYRVAESEWSPEKARPRLERFISRNMPSYKTDRDRMDMDGTSRLSPYLRFGILSARECARAAAQQEVQGMSGASTWMNELIWRDFYAMILAHYPKSATEEYQSQYLGMPWRYDEDDFNRFTQGLTGYPIVDAAMRELLTTGIMHNRARMIVASFMTKDLLIDWRWGEKHFARYLMDYDLASNVGGWQWAASTGTDAQPYFRIFNPLLQSQKFDPEGKYIRRFVPELAHLSARDIHEPAASMRPASYPAPIVDHAKVKERVLNVFKSYRP